MNKSHIMKTVCAVGLSAACVWGLSACTSGTQASGESGAVAATVNGVEISEDAITNYIENVRAQMSVTDEDAWGKWLAQNGYTPESVREEIVNTFIQREIVRMGAEERGVKVESSEVDGYVDQMKQNYDTDEKWQTALQQAGMTEEEYRAEIELQLKNQGLQETFTSDEEPSEADLLQYAQMYASTYDGAKRSSHILFDSGDEATAQEVLDKLNAGELDFAEAAKQYSKDTGTAQNGGDVGWDKTSSLVTEYTDGLAPLEKDQISGLVTSTYGIHIIKCTDVFNAPKTKAEDGTETVEVTSMDQIPAEWADSIKAALKSQKQNEAYHQWIEEYKEGADIVINPMPEGLPYAVDMSKYPAPETSTDGTTDGTNPHTDGTTDGATDGAADGATDGATEGAEGGEGADANAENPTQPTENPDAASTERTEQPAAQ